MKTKVAIPATGPLAHEPGEAFERPWGETRRAGQRRRRGREMEEAWQVVVDVHDRVPIVPAELMALEAHLGAAIDAILGAGH